MHFLQIDIQTGFADPWEPNSKLLHVLLKGAFVKENFIINICLYSFYVAKEFVDFSL